MKVKLQFINTQFCCPLTKRYVVFGGKDITVNGLTTPTATEQERQWFLDNGYSKFFEEVKEEKPKEKKEDKKS
jgi:hypothetical protein